MVFFWRRISDGTDWLVRMLAVPIGLFTILIVFFEVLMRYVFQAPLITSVELARLGFVWSCFLGAVLGYKRERHIQFVFLLDLLDERGRRWMRVAVSLLSVGFFIVLLAKGIEMVQRVYETYFPALGFSQLWLYLPLPACAACMLIHAVAFLARDAASLRHPGHGRRPG